MPISRLCRLTLILLVAILATACTKSKLFGGKDLKKTEERVVSIYVWSEYTSQEVLAEFTRKTGIRVQESNYSSNEELLAKLQAGAKGFDIAVPSDYMVAIMAKLGMLRELDKSRIPNASGLVPKLLGKPYDPENRYSLPYGWSITGLAINRDLYKEPVTSWADLLTNDKVAGRLSLLDDVRETIGAALKLHGASLNTKDPAALAKAKETLLAAKPRVKAFHSTPADLLAQGEVVIAHMYSSEAMKAAHDSGRSIEFVVPKEGATLAFDNLVLLKDAPHPEAALELINHLLDAKANADLVARTFAGPVTQGIESHLTPALKANPVLFPSAELLTRCEMMEDLGEFTSAFDRTWTEIKAASH